MAASLGYSLPAVITEALAAKTTVTDFGLSEFIERANDKSSRSVVVTPPEMRQGDGRWLVDFLKSKGIDHCHAATLRRFVDGVYQGIGIPDKINTSEFEAAIFYPRTDRRPSSTTKRQKAAVAPVALDPLADSLAVLRLRLTGETP
ncbi:MAG: hypothetical protein ABI442_20060 [Gemmatimonadaceae bacterium]